MWKSFLACANLFHEHGKIFVGMSMAKFVGMEKFCGYEIILMGMKFWPWKNFVGYVMFDHGKFLWL